MEEKAHCVQMQYHQYSVSLIAFGGGRGWMKTYKIKR